MNKRIVVAAGIAVGVILTLGAVYFARTRFPTPQRGKAGSVNELRSARAALREGDRANAKRYLLEAGKTPGSPQLNSFGPNMLLAKELFAAGEREAVLEYFALCDRFWELGHDQLGGWSALVRTGAEPDFGANLLY